VVRICLSPAKDPGRRVQLAGIARSFNRSQASDQLLVKISAFGQGPATDAIEGFPPECEAGVESAGGVLPNNQNIPLCQAGKSVEFLRQRAEAAGDADDLPAIAGFVFQLASIVEDDQLPLATGRRGAVPPSSMGGSK
jgi:hypothetical protein